MTICHSNLSMFCLSLVKESSMNHRQQFCVFGVCFFGAMNLYDVALAQYYVPIQPPVPSHDIMFPRRDRQRTVPEPRFRQSPNPSSSDMDTFGAIAHSNQAGRFGHSWGFMSRQAAEEAAMRECGASDCKIILWAVNAFMSLFQSKDGSWATAWGPTLDEAFSKTSLECRRVARNPDTCTVSFWKHTDGTSQ
jgi:Domain of unknown function (DUF4189)